MVGQFVAVFERKTTPSIADLLVVEDIVNLVVLKDRRFDLNFHAEALCRRVPEYENGSTRSVG